MLKSSDTRLKLVLFVLAFLMFANTIGHDYAWDDSIVILENPHVKRGFIGIPELFLKSNSDYRADKYGYRPIVLTSFAIEYGLFKQNPRPGHFMNVFYFALLCTVMFSVLRKLFFKLSNLVPFLATLLFLVHPVHVEVVANIKSRDEIFALMFSLLSLSQFMKYYKDRRTESLVFSILLFLLAFLSKESAITFLAVVPLAVMLMEEKFEFRKLLKPAAFAVFLLVLCLAIVKLYMSTSRGTELSKGAGIFYESGILGNSFFYTDLFGTKLANAFTVLWLYLRNFLWPLKLVYFYGYNQVPVANWSQPLVILSAFFHLGLVLLAILKWKTWRELSFAILFYLFTISIYTHLFRTLADTMADRFLFAPSLGLCLLTVLLLTRWFKLDTRSVNTKLFWSFDGQTGLKGKARSLKYLFLVLMAVLAVLTFNRNKVWKNNATLSAHDMPLLENCSRAHNYYADNLKGRLMGNYDAATEAEMIRHYRKSIAISKEAYYSFIGLGSYYTSARNFKAAIALLDSMVKLFPGQADASFYLGQAYSEAGDPAKAVFYLERSLQQASEVLSTYYALSIAYAKNKDFDKALAMINKAKEKFGESVTIYDALGNIYYEQGDLERSATSTLEMLRFGGDPKKTYGLVIGRFQVKKQDKLAAKYYNEAVARGVFVRGQR